MTTSDWLSELKIKTVPLSEWRANRARRNASLSACKRFDKSPGALVTSAQRFVSVPIMEPLPREGLLAECLRVAGVRGPTDVLLQPLHFLGWSAAVLLHGPVCAIHGCNQAPTALDHDHCDVGGSGLVRGLLCASHNNAAHAQSGPDAHLRTRLPEMVEYLRNPPLQRINLTYVNPKGYPVGWLGYLKMHRGT